MSVFPPGPQGPGVAVSSMFKKIHFVALILLVAALFPACTRKENAPAKGVTVTDAKGQPVVISDAARIVTIGTAVTETVFALGEGGRIAGVDDSSVNYLAEAAKLPKVGSFRSISAEGVISLKPTLLICNADAGSPEALEQIRGAKITVLVLPVKYSLEGVKANITTVAKALGVESKAPALAQGIDADMKEVGEQLAKTTSKPKVIFCGKGANMPTGNLSGKNTGIDMMISLAGGTNPIWSFEGFRPMTEEAVVAAAPDILLMTEGSFNRNGGLEGALKFPGVALTPAGKNKRVLAVSDRYFMGFGPGIGKAVKSLSLEFHPELRTAK
jgi:iron complex transport system substrate-binding protein